MFDGADGAGSALNPEPGLQGLGPLGRAPLRATRGALQPTTTPVLESTDGSPSRAPGSPGAAGDGGGGVLAAADGSRRLMPSPRPLRRTPWSGISPSAPGPCSTAATSTSVSGSASWSSCSNPNTDVGLLSRLALGRHWQRLSEQQQARYEQLFGQVVIGSLARRLEQYVTGAGGTLDDHLQFLASQLGGRGRRAGQDQGQDAAGRRGGASTGGCAAATSR